MNRNANLEQRLRALEDGIERNGELYEDNDGTRFHIPEEAHFIIRTELRDSTREGVRYTVEWTSDISAEIERIRTLKRIP